MGPSVSFLLPLRIAQELPIRNSWELISESYRIPLPIFYFFELIQERANREVQTVNWEGAREGAVERGVKRGLKKAHKPRIGGKKGAQTVS